MILHGKDLIVSIDGNANMASKSCTLNVSAKSIVKTSPTSGDWEEVLSGKKSWSLTTNHLVKKGEGGSAPIGNLYNSQFYFGNSTADGWKARGHCGGLRVDNNFDEYGNTPGITTIEISEIGSIVNIFNFDKDGMGTIDGSRKSLTQYLNGDISGHVIGNKSIIAILTVGEFSISSGTCTILEEVYHVALPCVEFGNAPTSGEKTYDTSPIIIVGGKFITHGSTSLNSISNEVVFNMVGGQVYTPQQGIPRDINMVGTKVAVRMTDNNGDVWAGEAIVQQFKVTGTKGNLMAGSFSFKGNGELQTDSRLDYKPTPPPVYVNRIIIDMNKSNPAEMITGDINGDIFQQMIANTHRYLGKYQGGGNMILCQLDDNNSNLFEDGVTTAPIGGTHGDVYVRIGGAYIPGEYANYYIYYKMTNLGNNRYELAVSSTYMQGFSVFDTEGTLIGAFKAQATKRYYDGTAPGEGEAYYLRSIAAARNSLTDIPENIQKVFGGIPPERKMNPAYFGLVGPEEHAIVTLLYFLKYGTANSKSKCGIGYDGPMVTGYAANMGINDTDSITGASVVNIFGLENWWSGGPELMERIRYAYPKIYTTPLGSSEEEEVDASIATGTTAPVIRTMLFQEDPLKIIPQGIQPNSVNYNTYFCNALRLTWTEGLMCRGLGGEMGGISSLGLVGDATAVGTRICFRNGTLQYLQDATDFLNTPNLDPAN
jgi:hypothetical protein